MLTLRIDGFKSEPSRVGENSAEAFRLPSMQRVGSKPVRRLLVLWDDDINEKMEA